VSRSARFAIAAVVCALLAGWLTLDYTGRAKQSTGPLGSVVVASGPLERGEQLGPEAQLGLRRVPLRFAPPDALSDPAEAIGERLLVAIPTGGFITRSALSGANATDDRFKLRAGERALTVDVVVSPTGETLAAGDRVDLFASGFGGDQQTVALIAGAEVLDVAEGGAPERERPTLRLAGSQVAAVVRADVFAHELRAVLRP
jgi:pilus assembly protein CpaB